MTSTKANPYDFCFWDRDGKAITMKQWCIESSSKYAFAKEKHTNGLRILTKWTGVDMPEYDWMVKNSFSVAKWKPNFRPKVFVSYVWNEDEEIVISKRYGTIEQAYEGHHKLIAQIESMDFGVYHFPANQLEEVNG
jgi:hypothetical protein